MVIETTSGKLYSVQETHDVNLAHVWLGREVKLVKGAYVTKAKVRDTLVRKAGCKVIVS